MNSMGGRWIRAAQLFAGAVAIAPILAAGSIVGYYPFDDDFEDASGNANHLFAPGAVADGPAITRRMRFSRGRP